MERGRVIRVLILPFPIEETTLAQTQSDLLILFSILYSLFRADVLELVGCVHKVVGVGLGGKFALLGRLDKVLVPLLFGEGDGVLLGLEVEVGALHHVARRLPAHQRVFPAMALGQHVPVHAPVVRAPVPGLRGGLGGLEDSVVCGGANRLVFPFLDCFLCCFYSCPIAQHS